MKDIFSFNNKTIPYTKIIPTATIIVQGKIVRLKDVFLTSGTSCVKKLQISINAFKIYRYRKERKDDKNLEIAFSSEHTMFLLMILEGRRIKLITFKLKSALGQPVTPFTYYLKKKD